VHHGGIGTAAQALAAGVPHLVMPIAHDQLDNAARLCRLGVAQSLSRRKFRAAAVARMLGELLASKEVSANCQTVAARVKESRPIDQTCDLLEELGSASPAATHPGS